MAKSIIRLIVISFISFHVLSLSFPCLAQRLEHVNGLFHFILLLTMRNGLDPIRWQAMTEAAEFFRALLFAPIARVAIENPVMHPYALEIIGARATQFVQPWQFGHGEIKATGLWLRKLPPLVPTEIVSGRAPRVHHASPGPERWRERSRTLPGIAAAFAAQWG